MRVHYAVAAHRDPAQLGDLVAALDAPWTRTHVHVDADADLSAFATPEVRERATFVTDRVKVKWGGWSVAEGMIRGMRSAAPEMDDDDYLVVLSGDSYPLASPLAVRTFFEQRSGDQFIGSVPFPAPHMSKDLRRVSQYWLEMDTREGVRNPLVRLVNRVGVPRDWRKAYGSYQPLTGSSWVTLTGAAVRWILAEMERNPGFVRFSRHTRNASEQIFQTLLGASPYAGRTRRHLMYVDWSEGQSWPATLGERHVALFAASETMEFSHDDYGTGPVLFARKVASDSPVAGQLREIVWPRWDRILDLPALETT